MHPSNLSVLPPNSSVNDFNEIVANANGLVVADFFASWCPPCQRLVSELPNLANENPNVTFVKVNVEENPNVASQYNVTSIPHVAFLKNDGGQPKSLDKVVGFNISLIKQNIQKYN